MPADDQPTPIGPGRLVVVVGPSGAGKDTLLSLARDQFTGNAAVVFPRRIVTREPSAAEDNVRISETDFVAAAATGGFAFWWDAHGLKYALGAAIDDDIRSGKTIVCNVSRTAIARLRRRYAYVRIVLVTAPPDVLAARLAARGRVADGAIAGRLARSVAASRDLSPDAVIENVADPPSGAAKLIEVIREGWV